MAGGRPMVIELRDDEVLALDELRERTGMSIRGIFRQALVEYLLRVRKAYAAQRRKGASVSGLPVVSLDAGEGHCSRADARTARVHRQGRQAATRRT